VYHLLDAGMFVLFTYCGPSRRFSFRLASFKANLRDVVDDELIIFRFRLGWFGIGLGEGDAPAFEQFIGKPDEEGVDGDAREE